MNTNYQTVFPYTAKDFARNLLVSGDWLALSELCGVPPETAREAVKCRENLFSELSQISAENPCVWEVLGKSIEIEGIEENLVNSLLNPT
jgi:hypothetical protein